MPMATPFSLQHAIQDQAQQQRIDKLQQQMQHYGMQIRDDSKLALLYATNQDADASQDYLNMIYVAQEMYKTQYVYNTTNLTAQMQTVLQPIADLLHQKYTHVPWRVIWKRVRTFIIPIIKIKALQDSQTQTASHTGQETWRSNQEASEDPNSPGA